MVSFLSVHDLVYGPPGRPTDHCCPQIVYCCLFSVEQKSCGKGFCYLPTHGLDREVFVVLASCQSCRLGHRTRRCRLLLSHCLQHHSYLNAIMNFSVCTCPVCTVPPLSSKNSCRYLHERGIFCIRPSLSRTRPKHSSTEISHVPPAMAHRCTPFRYATLALLCKTVNNPPHGTRAWSHVNFHHPPPASLHVTCSRNTSDSGALEENRLLGLTFVTWIRNRFREE